MISSRLSAFWWRIRKPFRRPPPQISALVREAQRARAKHRRSKHIQAQIMKVRHALLKNEGKRA